MKDNAATNEVKDMIFIWLSFPLNIALNRQNETNKNKQSLCSYAFEDR